MLIAGFQPRGCGEVRRWCKLRWRAGMESKSVEETVRRPSIVLRCQEPSTTFVNNSLWNSAAVSTVYCTYEQLALHLRQAITQNQP